jgi:hypothetical protein
VLAHNKALHYLAHHPLTADERAHLTEVVHGYTGPCDVVAARGGPLAWLRERYRERGEATPSDGRGTVLGVKSEGMTRPPTEAAYLPSRPLMSPSIWRERAMASRLVLNMSMSLGPHAASRSSISVDLRRHSAVVRRSRERAGGPWPRSFHRREHDWSLGHRRVTLGRCR